MARFGLVGRMVMFMLGAAMAFGSGLILLAYLTSGGLKDVWRESNVITVAADALVLVVGLQLIVMAIRRPLQKQHAQPFPNNPPSEAVEGGERTSPETSHSLAQRDLLKF